MKKIKKLSAILLVVLVFFGAMMTTAFAADVSQDGLEVSLVTDKETYNQGEQIAATLSVKNTNEFAVKNVTLENLIPDGYVLADGASATKELESLEPGETAKLAVTFVAKGETPTDPTNPTDPTEPTDPDEPTCPGNNDWWKIVLPIVGVTGLVGIIIALVQFKKILALILAILIAGSIAIVPHAEAMSDGSGKRRTIKITETVKLDGAKKKIKATVMYDLKDAVYTVEFNSNGGSEVDSQKVKSGETATIPVAPTNGELMFVGWFTGEGLANLGKPFSFDTPIEKDMVLYAGWVDSKTDTDGDGIPDDMENYMGTDKNSADTDGDGLNDYQEKMIFDYDPLNVDTDGNGVKDCDEDHDSDKLTNIWELKNGTDPILKDTDNDGLNDYEELNKYKTKPTNSDTDGDKANDGDEVRLGTDPLVAETQFVEKVSGGELTESRNVSVDVEAVVDGGQVGSMEVYPVSPTDMPDINSAIPGYIGYAYDISAEGQPKSATLTFRYDTSVGQISESFQPRVYYYNETTRTFEELPNQKVSEGVVRVNVSHFSTYILLNKVEFDKVWNTEIRNPDDTTPGMTGLDIVFAIDSSGSMTSNDRNWLRIVAAKQFIDKLGKNDRAAVVDFDNGSRLLQGFTSDKDLLYSAVDRIDSSGGTSLSAGMSKSIEQFTSSSYTRTDAYKYIIFLTDGEGGYSNSYTKTASENGIVVYTIGLGSGVKEAVLKEIANGTGGKYYFASSAENLPDIYDDVSFETIDYTTDSNNDGISDYYTELIKKGELTLNNGSREFFGFDFNYDENGNPSDDYDGDGVKNGDELVVSHNGNCVYVKMVSDPAMVHSDGDGISDGDEHSNGTDPMVATYQRYYVDSPLNDSEFTYVDVFNEEDEWLNRISGNIWSTVTFNWSHQDEAKAFLVSFFNEYDNLNNIKNVTEEIKKESAELMGLDFIGVVSKLYDFDDVAVETIKYMKKWCSAGNSAKNLNTTHLGKFKAQVNFFKNKLTNQGLWDGTLDIKSSWDKLGFGCTVAKAVFDEVNGLYDCIEAYSSVVATQNAFTKNRDILECMKSNDKAKEKFVTRAADDILLVVNEQYNNFKNEEVKDFMVLTVENFASFCSTILSMANPYVAAVKLLVDVIDLVSPIKKINESCYYLYVIDELVTATKELFSYKSSTKTYYDIVDENLRYIEILACARIWGGEFAVNITENQMYLGAKDDDVRKAYADEIAADNKRMDTCLTYFASL